MDVAFAVIENQQSYGAFYDELLGCIKQHFAHVESGIQGDAWIWITRDGHKVAVDTFTAMQFEIKAADKNELLQAVIDVLQTYYPVRLYDPPIER